MHFYFPLGYRLNKFCGEHLKVKNESPEPEPELSMHQQRSVSNENDIQSDDNGMQRDGPFAEALIQNELMFHHLKILKPSPSETENERRKSASMAGKLDKPAPRKGVYSQVCDPRERKNFRLLQLKQTKRLMKRKLFLVFVTFHIKEFPHISMITPFT